MDRPVLCAEGLRKDYGPVAALEGVDLSVSAGEIVAILGANGAGKTTLVSLVAGLLRPDAGRVEVCGVDVSAKPERRPELVGLAPQRLGVYPTLSARENLALFGELGGLRGKALADRIEATADRLALTGLLGRLARTLSGGEQRRLHVAMALMRERPLLLLDEPVTGLDMASREAVLRLERDLASSGTAVCHATNDPREAKALAARRVVLERGRVVPEGDTDVAPA
jgi:ABC-2 type transport system ATP-binding protein